MNDDRTHKLDSVFDGVDAAESRRLLQVWHILGEEDSATLLSDERVEQARAMVMAATELNGRRPNGRRRERTPRARRPSRRRLLWPASGALFAAIILVWWMLPVTTQAPRGTQTTVELADRSTVQLNSGAQLRYGRALGWMGAERRVRLHGEAFFDVSTADRPFVVETFNAEVTVLGTRFNVRAWTDLEASTMVTVEIGRVRVRAPDGRTATLTNGEHVRIGTDLDSVSVGVEDALAWRTGDLVYKDRMLGVVLEDIVRRFDVEVALDPAISETLRIGIAHREPEEAEDVIRDLAAALGFQYRARSNGYELYQP